MPIKTQTVESHPAKVKRKIKKGDGSGGCGVIIERRPKTERVWANQYLRATGKWSTSPFDGIFYHKRKHAIEKRKEATAICNYLKARTIKVSLPIN